MPCGVFLLLDEATVADLNESSLLGDDGLVRYVLEVDLEYPTKIHEAHADFSF